MCFIADRAPRAFLKGIKGYTAYYACERCIVEGYYLQNRVIYQSVECERRTNKSFREFKNSQHHNEVSPLIFINPPIDMIGDFPLEEMHLVFLGVMKKLLVDY